MQKKFGVQLEVPIELVAEQRARTPIDHMFSARVSSAMNLGLHILRAPRIGMIFFEDPDNSLYIQDSDTDALAQRLGRYSEALLAIEARSLGLSRLQQTAAKWAVRAGVVEPWCQSLGRAKDIHEQRVVERAFAEWSDADSIAAHIGYGMELFCTEDKGHTGGDPSVFDVTNRLWLEKSYGVKFVTLEELAARL